MSDWGRGAWMYGSAPAGTVCAKCDRPIPAGERAGLGAHRMRTNALINRPAVTLREIAAAYGYPVNRVRDWSTRCADWPAVVGTRRAGSSRGAPAHLYAADDVAAWVQQYTARPRPDNRWTTPKVAAELGVGLKTVRKHRRRGTFPPPDGYRGQRAWWHPETVLPWRDTMRVPPGAWTLTDIAAHTGRRNPLTRTSAPTPDGVASRTRWWWPDTITTWWNPIAQTEREGAAARDRAAARHRAERERAAAHDHAPAVEAARWFSRDVAHATGLTYDSIRTYRKLHKLPPPDGTTRPNGGRPWWYPATIIRWDRPGSVGRPRSGTGCAATRPTDQSV